ncbi:MAG: hypothetical protein QG657_1869 [Acidobacteriota bacterium]|nr:hypothetical protein [Acidobacteriota bacterium]
MGRLFLSVGRPCSSPVRGSSFFVLIRVIRGKKLSNLAVNRELISPKDKRKGTFPPTTLPSLVRGYIKFLRELPGTSERNRFPPALVSTYHSRRFLRIQYVRLLSEIAFLLLYDIPFHNRLLQKMLLKFSQ